jgi:hypothetical protein
MKRAVTLIASACWLLFAIGFGVLLVQYLLGGAGLQFSAGLFSDSSVLIGMVHVTGLAFASLGCLAVGAALWARAFARAKQEKDAE